MGVPLQIQGRVIGMVGLSRDRLGQPYTADDQIFLQELADRAALTLQNAQLFEQIQQAHEWLQALSLRLLVESAPGSGACVTVELPLAQDHQIDPFFVIYN